MDVVRDEKTLHSMHCSISWSAIIAGALVAFSLSVLLNLLNAGLGLVSFPQVFNGLMKATAGAYIWVIIWGIIAMFLAGWVAGKIGQRYSTVCYGALHGFLAWSLALLFPVLIASHFAHAGTEMLNTAHGTTSSRDAVVSAHEQISVEQAEHAVNAMGVATVGIFFIFLSGAIASCVGGYVGAKHGCGSLCAKPKI